jgi:4-amino-4-deoxy-L-arabinose transferase-like glycosyltransferase
MPFGPGASGRAARQARRVAQALLRGDPLESLIAGIALLSLLRIVQGAVLPLSFDEAYYWLWSRHLAAGYFDHPPAIAFVIRAGTLLFGNSVIAIRAVPLALSLAASWAVWRSAHLLLGSTIAAAQACLYFNLTLMVAVETMAATPDAPALAAAALVVLTLAELQDRGDGRWWLGVGLAGGLCLLSKYTGVFLAAGTGLWCIASPRGRVWLATPWPYLGVLVALACFAPVIAWNAQHDWISFRFQAGRVANGGFTLRYIGEFIAAQAALASPFLLVLGVAGFVRATQRPAGALALAAALIWPAALYFAVHSTHDRVQGNWPSFLFPAFAILAASGARETWRGMAPVMNAVRRAAVPVAVLILAIVSLQAFFGLVKARDPIARLTGFGFPVIAEQVGTLARAQDAPAIVTGSYATTAWLAYYGHLPVMQINEPFRWLSAPVADPHLFRGTLLFVTLHAQKTLPEIEAQFSAVRFLARLERTRSGVFIESYDVYRVSGWRGTKLPRAP